MSDLQDVIVSSSIKAFNNGVYYERERIVSLLQPLAQCTELCEEGCYPEDCSAPSYSVAIGLIKGEQK